MSHAEVSSAATPAEDTHDPDGSSSLDNDSDDIEVEWDIAVTHKRNEELRKEESVRQFFAKVSTILSIWDQDIRDWLRCLPYYMRGKAIPLFENETVQFSEDYQLHLGYSWLPSGKAAQDPDPHFYRLSKCRNSDLQSITSREESRRLYIPLGRLFVNARNDNHFTERCNSKRSRLSRWTGYEVFLGDDANLWIIFDQYSLVNDAKPWYPVSCRITQPFQPPPGKACLTSLYGLEHSICKDVEHLAHYPREEGQMQIDEVEQSEVRERKINQVLAHSINAVPKTGPERQRVWDRAGDISSKRFEEATSPIHFDKREDVEHISPPVSSKTLPKMRKLSKYPSDDPSNDNDGDDSLSKRSSYPIIETPKASKFQRDKVAEPKPRDQMRTKVARE